MSSTLVHRCRIAWKAVLQSACAGTPSPRRAVLPAVDAVSSEWAADLERFAADDAAKAPPQHSIVFTGSSSIRLWDTLAGDFPNVPVLNRADYALWRKTIAPFIVP